MRKRVALGRALNGLAYAKRLFTAVVCALVLVGCAGDPVGDGSRMSSGRPGATAGSGANAGAGGSAGSGSFGNGNGGKPTKQPTGNTAPPPPLPQGERQLVKQDSCPGMVAADAAGRLTNPGVSAGSGRLLYPYDQTVFPQGLAAPVLQWDAPEN